MITLFPRCDPPHICSFSAFCIFSFLARFAPRIVAAACSLYRIFPFGDRISFPCLTGLPFLVIPFSLLPGLRTATRHPRYPCCDPSPVPPLFLIFWAPLIFCCLSSSRCFFFLELKINEIGSCFFFFPPPYLFSGFFARFFSPLYHNGEYPFLVRWRFPLP